MVFVVRAAPAPAAGAVAAGGAAVAPAAVASSFGCAVVTSDVSSPAEPSRLPHDFGCCTAPGSTNSWVDTVNLLAAPNSRRKVRLNCTVGSRSVVHTVDMSAGPAAGTYRRSADQVHDQRQVSRKCLAESSGGGPGPRPGSGCRYGGGVSGLAAASLEIPCSLVMPPGRHQFGTAIFGLGAGMWFWEVGSLGEGWRQDL